MRTNLLVVACSALAASAGSAPADVVEIGAAKDNTLIESNDGSLSNGSGEFFFTGATDQSPGDRIRRGVIMFDVAASVPAGSTINSVTLQLYMSRAKSNTNRTTSLHVIDQDWGEGASDAEDNEGAGASAEPGDATWIHTFHDGSFWSNDGGDYQPLASASESVGGNGFYTWGSTTEMVADVLAWLENPGSNFGWVVIGVENTTKTAKRFNSRQFTGQAARRPKLTIDFTPAAQTGACCLFDGGCSLVNSQSECDALGGDFQGLGEACVPNPCPQPEGACCFDDGSCQLRTQVDCAAQGGEHQGDLTLCADVSCPVVLTPFVDPLPLPAVAEPIPGDPNAYEIAITRFGQTLHSDLPPTTVYGFGGSYPGPTIEAVSGQPITVTWINDLRDDQNDLLAEHDLMVDICAHGADDQSPRTVVHLHGGHVPPEVDGYPEAWFAPGGQDVYVYPNNQDAATIWYHDHALGITRLNVMMGMAGFYLVRDAFEDALGLPSEEYEIPIVIQDRTFDANGEFVYPELWQADFHGDTILVNGKVWPFLNVNQDEYRFRILNGSNSRTYTLTLDNGQGFRQIGTDGGLLPAPVDVAALTLASGERADVVIDFSALSIGTEVILTNSAPASFPGEAGVGVIPNVMKFIVTAPGDSTGVVPAELRPITALDEADARESRDFILKKVDDPCTGQRWEINGLGWVDITEYPRLETIEIWRFVNDSGMMHPMHMHLVFFQVLDRQAVEIVDGEVVPIGEPFPPAPEEAGWKDTVKVNPGEAVRVIARFEDYEGLFSYHCHILEHEDHEMMRQFQTRPACIADLDWDDTVGFGDILSVLSAWGPCGECPQDLDGDGIVGFSDLLTVLSAWGPCD